MGLIPGMISCAFSGLTAAFGLYLLSRCATQVGRPRPSTSSTEHAEPLKPRQQQTEASFNAVAKLTFGQGWATRCFDAAIAIKCFGVSVSYLIIVKVRKWSRKLSHSIARFSDMLTRRNPFPDPNATSHPLPFPQPPNGDSPSNIHAPRWQALASPLHDHNRTSLFPPSSRFSPIHKSSRPRLGRLPRGHRRRLVGFENSNGD